MKTNDPITISTTVSAPLNRAWEARTQLDHILRWNFASTDWHSPWGEQDFEEGKRFRYRMEAKDGSMGFDFSGIFEEIIPYEYFSYRLDDNRQSVVRFEPTIEGTRVSETFKAAEDHPADMQRNGWQAILDNYKSYVETQGKLTMQIFQIDINAPAEIVYRRMLDDVTYREWTAEFSPGSFADGTWEKGSKIYFLGPDKGGRFSGIVSRIAENHPNRRVLIEHQGLVNEGKEVTEGMEVEGWKGAMENYHFIPSGNGTLLIVNLETPGDHRDYFDESWPRALNKLKEIAERN